MNVKCGWMSHFTNRCILPFGLPRKPPPGTQKKPLRQKKVLQQKKPLRQKKPPLRYSLQILR